MADVQGVDPADLAAFQKTPQYIDPGDAAAFAQQRQPKTDPMQRLEIDFNNQQSAAGQRTTPIISAQAPNALGPATENEVGEVGYKDEQGNFVPTDKNKHVVLTDPSDNTPKVYARTQDTDESALSSAGRLMGTGMGAGNIEVSKALPAAVSAADRLGVSVPKAIATDSPLVRFGGQVLSKAPGGGPLTEAIPQSIEQLGGKVSDAANLAAGEISPVAAGEGFKSSVTDFFKPAVKQATGDAYDRVAALVDPTKTSQLTATQGALADIVARRHASGEENIGKAVDTVLGGATRPGGLTFNGIKDLRTRVGEMLDTRIFPEGMSQGELKQIYGGLSQDLTNAARNGGGDRAVTAFQKANDLHSAFSSWKDQLQKVLGPETRSGEGIYQAIVRMASSGASADQKALFAARSAVRPEAWQNVSSTAISTLGRGRNGEWSPSAFLSDYRNLSDQGKRILFGGAGSSNVVPFLDDIASVSNKFVKAGKLGNTSGTAGHNVAYTLLGAGATGLAHGSLVEPVTAAAAVLGVNVMSRVLASPATAASMARWSRVYSRVAENPGPASLAALNRSSGEFAKTVNSAFGTNIDPSRLFRSVQSPSGANADQEQQSNPRLPSQ